MISGLTTGSVGPPGFDWLGRLTQKVTPALSIDADVSRLRWVWRLLRLLRARPDRPARLPRNRLPAFRKLRRRSCPRNPRLLRRYHRQLSDRQSESARTTDGLRSLRRR